MINMFLTKKEEQMCDGEFGETVRKSMDILVALGDIYGASKLVDITSAQVSGVSYKTIGDAGLEYLQDLAVVNKETNKDYILGSAKMYKRALDVANKNKNPYLISCAQKAQTVLKSFCEMNNIILDIKEL